MCKRSRVQCAILARLYLCQRRPEYFAPPLHPEKRPRPVDPRRHVSQAAWQSRLAFTFRNLIPQPHDSRRMKAFRLAPSFVTAVWFATTSASAQVTSPPSLFPGNDQQARQQEEARERERTISAPRLRSSVTEDIAFPALPSEASCYTVNRIELDIPEAVKSVHGSTLLSERFAFAQVWLDHYAGTCIGNLGFDVLVQGVSRVIAARGYMTSRVVFTAQDVSTGTLKLALIPGFIRHIRFSDDTQRGTWKAAFPTGDGELLNLRDLEQGVEQMKTVTNQNVSTEIVPTDMPGKSDVVLTVTREKPWTLIASVDDSGTRDTGRPQGNLSLGLYNPLGLNDIFNLGVGQDLELRHKHLGSRSGYAFYSVPWGYWRATIEAHAHRYHQQIATVNQTFVASGDSKNVDLKLSRVLARSHNDIVGAQIRLSRRFGQSFIEDIEIAQHRRNNTSIEVALTERHYFGRAQFDGMFAYRQGIGWLGAQDDVLAQNGGPTYRYKMMVVDANLAAPFSVAQQSLKYVTTFRGQYTGNALYYLDNLTIGSRHTVRGFDGATMLAGSRGFYWRNELQGAIARSEHAIYAGLDYGRVWAQQAHTLVGSQLAGAVIGVKGSAATQLGKYGYDIFAGTPLYRPAGFPAPEVTFGFHVMGQL